MTSSITPAPADRVHPAVKAADTRHALEQRLAAAEAVCELTASKLCGDAGCQSPLCKAIRTWQAFAAVVVLLFVLATPARAQRLDSLQTIGRYVSGAMTMVGISQDSLARLVPTLRASQSARVARISVIRNGTAFAPDSELTLLGRALLQLWLAQADTGRTERRATQLYFNARLFLAPPRPATPSVRTAAITGARVASNANARGTYRLDVPGHGLSTGTLVTVRGHSATPAINGQTVYVQVIDATILWLWYDALLTRPVVIATPGTGGTIEVRP